MRKNRASQIFLALLALSLSACTGMNKSPVSSSTRQIEPAPVETPEPKAIEQKEEPKPEEEPDPEEAVPDLPPEDLQGCDCDKIKQEGYCEDLNCINVCGIRNSFDEMNKALVNQCLAGSSTSPDLDFSSPKPLHVGLSGDTMQKHLANTGTRIKEIEAEDRELLEKNCPNCELKPEYTVNTEIESIPNSCPEEYLKKHFFAKYLKAEQSEDCAKELNKQFKDTTTGILQPIIMGQSDLCPRECSPVASYTMKVKHKLCEGLMDLTLNCTHKAKDHTFISPYYNISIDYKKTLQCR